MKTLFASAAASAAASVAASVAFLAAATCLAAGPSGWPVDETFEVERMPFGSGTPASGVTGGTETANPVADGLFHVPNYLPGFPTAATLWPREVPVECMREAGVPKCTGFWVLPTVGRGEYIFVRPTMKEVAPPVVHEIIREVPAPAPEPLPVSHKKPLG